MKIKNLIVRKITDDFNANSHNFPHFCATGHWYNPAQLQPQFMGQTQQKLQWGKFNLIVAEFLIKSLFWKSDGGPPPHVGWYPTPFSIIIVILEIVLHNIGKHVCDLPCQYGVH